MVSLLRGEHDFSVGDEILSSAWRHWVSGNGPRLLLFARQQTRCEEDARDVLQEALVDAWRRSGGAVPDLALVFAGIRRRAIDFARREERRRRRDGEWLDQGFGEGWFVDGGVEHRELEAALRGIRADFAEVVVLKVWGGLTFDEVARTLGVNAATVASRYRYALRDLQEVLEGTGKAGNRKES